MVEVVPRVTTSRAMVVDDHPVVSDAIVLALTSLRVFNEVVTANSLAATLKILHDDPHFDLLMFDLHLSDSEGIEGLTTVREKFPDVPLIIFSGDSTSQSIATAFEHGVRGYIPKSSPMQVVINAIRMVLSGSAYIPPEAIRMMGFEPCVNENFAVTAIKPTINLSPKQLMVFTELLSGMPNKVIAARLDMAEGTVKTHLHTIYQVLGVRNRAQAILKARELGII